MKAMEKVRNNLAAVAHRALVDRVSTLVTNNGRPYFLICPPTPDRPLATLDERLRAAIGADDDTAVAGVADELDEAGLSLLAADVRARRAAGLRGLIEPE